MAKHHSSTRHTKTCQLPGCAARTLSSCACSLLRSCHSAAASASMSTPLASSTGGRFSASVSAATTHSDSPSPSALSAELATHRCRAAALPEVLPGAAEDASADGESPLPPRWLKFRSRTQVFPLALFGEDRRP